MRALHSTVCRATSRHAAAAQSLLRLWPAQRPAPPRCRSSSASTSSTSGSGAGQHGGSAAAVAAAPAAAEARQQQPRLLDAVTGPSVLEHFDTLIFDQDGVLWRGQDPIPNAVEALHAFRRAGKRLLFVTNNSSKSRAEYVEKFASLGITVTAEEIVSSSYTVAAYLDSIGFRQQRLAAGRKPCVLLMGSSGMRDELEAVGLQVVDAEDLGLPLMDNVGAMLDMQLDPRIGAVVLGWDARFSYSKLVYATALVREQQCLFVATNLDHADAISGSGGGGGGNGGSTGRVMPGTGSLVAALQVASGVQPAYTDNMHVHDAVGPQVASRECSSQAVKVLKQRLLKRIIDTHNMDQCLIFCRTNFDCDNLEKFLLGLGGAGGGGSGAAAFRGKRESGKEHPYSCVVLAGQRSMEERRRALQAFKDGDVRFLVCTDVAARGIDISGLPYVINMTLPDKSEDYIHRVGRVGRADHMGLAISLVSSVPEKVWFCTVKGYKPWLEADANNTRLQEQGGHAIWYDEPALLKEVEARLGASIPSLAADLSLPPELQARLAGEGGAYGQARGGGVSAEVTERLEGIRQNVEALVALEWAAQTSFLTLKRKWVGGGGGVAAMEA